MSGSGRRAPREQAPGIRAGTASGRRRRLIGTLAMGAAVVVAAAVVLSGAHASVVGRTSPPPWPAPGDVEQRASAAGLAMLGAEGKAMHIHEHLSVTVDGRHVQVPALLGIDEAAHRIAAIHTHDTTGIIHVESPVARTFRLGQVFTEWDVALGPGRVGGFVDGRAGDRVTVFVGRRLYHGDPARIVLGRRQDIDIAVTTDGAAAKAPATRFVFPPGY